MRGKLIVIEGTDGSGKATQIRLLQRRLEQEGHNVKTLSFPNYESLSSGPVQLYLRGFLGSADDVNPYGASLLYAVDRVFQSNCIKRWLKEGYLVLLDRYVDSNAAHQGSKIKDSAEREKFLKWLYDLEYECFEMPRPDFSILLVVPAAVTQKLMQGRKESDIHESNLFHLTATEEAYLWCVAQNRGRYDIVECVDGENEMLSREVIAEEVWAQVKKRLKFRSKE